MNKLICAVFFTAMTTGPAMAAGDVLAQLTESAPSTETAVLPSPAPVAETPSVPAPAGTPLTMDNIQGEYVVGVKMEGMPPMQVTYAEGKATLVKPHSAGGNLVCEGTYALDVNTSLLVTDFPDCSGSTLSHTMNLTGQTLETLTAGADVTSSIKMDGDVTPGVPVNIKKVK